MINQIIEGVCKAIEEKQTGRLVIMLPRTCYRNLIIQEVERQFGPVGVYDKTEQRWRENVKKDFSTDI